LTAFLCFTSCSSENEPAEQPKRPEAVTGRTAFQNMYGAARMWHADAEPLIMESGQAENLNGTDGKAGIWRATFVSNSGSVQRDFLYITVDLGDGLGRGVRQGHDSGYSGGTGVEQPFAVAFLKTDSDSAYQIAEKQGGTDLRKKDKEMQVFYTLRREVNSGVPNVVWDVIYGHTRSTAPLTVHVDASTGKFLFANKPNR
jgi:hypothetical protein